MDQRKGPAFSIESFGGVELLRPSRQVEDEVRRHIKDAVFGEFKPGYYEDVQKINEIIKFVFKLHHALIDEQLRRLNRFQLSLFLLDQYECYARARSAYEAGGMSEQEQESWRSYASHSRRGFKIVLELLCRQSRDPDLISASEGGWEYPIATLIIAAEELVHLYIRSDQYVCMDRLDLILIPSADPYLCILQDASLRIDHRQDQSDTARHLSRPPFEQDVRTHDAIAGAAFVSTLGITYLEVIRGLLGIARSDEVDRPAPGVGVVRLRVAVEYLIDAYGLNVAQARRIIDGFSLTASNLRDREAFKPKQEHRARRRAFFTMRCSQDNDVLVFSMAMVEECLELLAIDLSYRQVAQEWGSAEVFAALDRLHHAAGRWFEAEVKRNLEEVGIQSICSVKRLSIAERAVMVLPADVGEIDIIGYSRKERLLVVVEAKQVQRSTEPKMYKQDMDKFVLGKKNYAEKFMRKYEWALANYDAIRAHLERKLGIEIDVAQVGYAMITHHPLVIADQMRDFSCVNIGQFRRAYQENGRWTFSLRPVSGGGGETSS